MGKVTKLFYQGQNFTYVRCRTVLVKAFCALAPVTVELLLQFRLCILRLRAVMGTLKIRERYLESDIRDGGREPLRQLPQLGPDAV
jgi:hypothetical protein